MKISVKIESPEESLRFQFAAEDFEGDTVEDLAHKAIERLQALYPQADEGLKLGTAYIDVQGQDPQKVAESIGEKLYDHVHEVDSEGRSLVYDPQKAAEAAQRAVDADQAAQEAVANPATAQENAGLAPWETEGDPEPSSKPKRRSNERLAADAGVKLDDVKEWKGGGRIVKADIEEFARLHANAVNNQTLDEAAQAEQDGQDGVPHEPAPTPEPEETPEEQFTEVTDDQEAEDDWQPPF